MVIVTQHGMKAMPGGSRSYSMYLSVCADQYIFVGLIEGFSYPFTLLFFESDLLFQMKWRV